MAELIRMFSNAAVRRGRSERRREGMVPGFRERCWLFGTVREPEDLFSSVTAQSPLFRDTDWGDEVSSEGIVRLMTCLRSQESIFPQTQRVSSLICSWKCLPSVVGHLPSEDR